MFRTVPNNVTTILEYRDANKQHSVNIQDLPTLHMYLHILFCLIYCA